MASFNSAVGREDQQKFIEEKRRKIQEKLAAAQSKLSKESSSNLTCSSQPQTQPLLGKRLGSVLDNSVRSKVIKTEAGSSSAQSSANLNNAMNGAMFSNDGNFLERFKKMQEMQSKEVKTETPLPAHTTDSDKIKFDTSKKPVKSIKQAVSFSLASNAKPKQSTPMPVMTVADMFDQDDQEPPVFVAFSLHLHETTRRHSVRSTAPSHLEREELRDWWTGV